MNQATIITICAKGDMEAGFTLIELSGAQPAGGVVNRVGGSAPSRGPDSRGGVLNRVGGKSGSGRGEGCLL
jgi:hypothetical protein